MILNVDPIKPFGVAIELAAIPASDSPDAARLLDLYRQHGLLVVRGLKLSQDEQIGFCRLFGPVPDSMCENFLVSNVDANGHLGTRELLWHNDVPYLPSPYLAGCLYALTVDEKAVGTRFASSYRAYEKLPATLQERISKLKGLHVRERVYDRRNKLTDLEEGDMCTVHSVVQQDPATGRKYIFVNQAWTAQIIGLSEDEEEALLAELFQYVYADDNIYEHCWAEGDMVLWDNLGVQHSRGLAGAGVRTLQRVTVAQLGYADQYPTDLKIGESLGNAEMLAVS